MPAKEIDCGALLYCIQCFGLRGSGLRFRGARLPLRSVRRALCGTSLFLCRYRLAGTFLRPVGLP